VLLPDKRRRLLGVGLTVGAVLVAATPSTAAGSPPTPSTSTPTPAPASAPVVDTHQVTLLTGDTVEVQRLANGRYAATPRPGRRVADGQPVTFSQLRTPAGDLYVVPSDAGAEVAGGRIDLDLFNVRRLVEDGYTDQRVARTPVIVQLDPAATERAPKAASDPASALTYSADALPATERVRPLRSIHAAATEVTKTDTETFWAKVRGPASGVRRVWLDRRIHATLDQSVPQIGTPAAWQAGYDGTGVTVAVLDTGVDLSHPDLSGKIAGTANFTSEPTAADGNGHGTHVASTVAGSGAASGGRYRGVAPGARLLIGKVLGSDGSGELSGLISGMEWAATSGARVVSISVGAGASDGQDPASLAVNELTARTGALFVIAAGNAGRNGPGTVSAPGSAAAALTVGAVDKRDRLADFSSRGPLTGSNGLKPDVTAPGVNIVAARAAGTSLTSSVPGDGPVDDYHTSLSGTSMATPHVSGAAALLAQRHPDWRAPQLKTALTSTAVWNSELSVYEQGAGRIDVARAIRQEVLASPSSLDFGTLEWPHSEPATRTVTLTNQGATTATLDLTAELTGPDGRPATDALTVEPARVTVPAGGSAEVRVTVDPTDRAAKQYSGVLRASAAGTDDEVLHLPIGLYLQPPQHVVRVRLVPPAGWAQRTRYTDFSVLWLARVDESAEPIAVERGDEPYVDVRVDDGVYLVSTTFYTYDPVTGAHTVTQLVDPEVVVRDRNVETVLDATTAVPVAAETPKPTETHYIWLSLRRGTADHGEYELVSGAVWAYHGDIAFRITPTRRVTIGTLRVATQFDLTEDLVSMRVARPGGHTFDINYAQYQFQEPKLSLDRTVDLVDAGDGSPEAISRARVRGRVALIQADWRTGTYVNATESTLYQSLARLRDAGAVAAIASVSEGLPWWLGPLVFDSGSGAATPQTSPLPVLVLGPGEAATARSLTSRGPVRVDLRARTAPSYTYRLRFEENSGRIGPDQTHSVRAHQLATVTSRYHGQAPSDVERNTYSVDPDGWQLGGSTFLAGPAEITDYVGPVSSRVLWTTSVHGTLVSDRDKMDADVLTPIAWEWAMDVYPKARHQTTDWMTPAGYGGYRAPEFLDGPLGAVAPTISLCAFCRTSEGLLPFVWEATGGGSHVGRPALDVLNYENTHYEAHLYRNGQELPGGPYWDLTKYPDPARYRYTLRVVGGTAPRPTTSYPSESETIWEFRSQKPTGYEGPAWETCRASETTVAPCRVERVLLLGYDLGRAVRLDNSGQAPGVGRIGLSVYQQAGVPRSHLRGIQVRVSYDRGEHWLPVLAVPRGDGRYEVTVNHPRGASSVSLHTVAWDDAGNRVEQTLLDLYPLRSAKPR